MHPPSASSTPPKATASTDKPSTGNAPHASCPPAALIALAIGYLLIRGRRLEIASALHCGVPKPALATQIIIETGITILLATAISLPIDMTAARLLIDTTDRTAITLNAIQTTITTNTAYLLATTITALHIKERHLFTYFKER